MHRSNYMEHCRNLPHLTRTKHDCNSAQCTFNWNTSVTVHEQSKVGLPQRKLLPRSTAVSSVSICRYTEGNDDRVWSWRLISLYSGVKICWALPPLGFSMLSIFVTYFSGKNYSIWRKTSIIKPSDTKQCYQPCLSVKLRDRSTVLNRCAA